MAFGFFYCFGALAKIRTDLQCVNSYHNGKGAGTGPLNQYSECEALMTRRNYSAA
jgi:hypothetical protein